MWKGREFIAHCAFVILCFLVFPQLMPTSAVVDFTISLPEVNGQEISFDATLSGITSTNCPDNRCYFHGTLRSVASSKYFGETANASNNWVDYVSSPDTEYIKANYYAADIQACSWFARLKMRFKIDDPNYQGPGNYDLKLRRYTGKSSNFSAESNTLNISLTALIPTPTSTLTPVPTPTASPAPTKTPTPFPTVTTAKTPIPTAIRTSTPVLETIADGGSSSGTPDILGSTDRPKAYTESSASGLLATKPLIVSLLFVSFGLALLSGLFVWQKRNAQS